MPTFYADETGFTGEDLMEEGQPFFVQATHNFDANETEKIIRDIFSEIKAPELKHTNLARRPAQQDSVVELIKYAANNENRVATWIAHKEFATVTMVVEWWLEPLAHRNGLNLYKDGANQAMANMLFACLEGFWDEKFRRKILLGFQRMVRARTQERFSEFKQMIIKAADQVALDNQRSELLNYFIPSFEFLGLQHVVDLPKHVLDLALPGLIRLGFHWRSLHEGPWEVVHDRSSNMAKQKWMWDQFTSAAMTPATFPNPHGDMIFPMNVTSTRFVDSINEKPIQLCDIFAGATASFCRLPATDPYRIKLGEAGIEKLVVDSIWPSLQLRPQN